MRPKVLFAILVIGCLLLILLFFARKEGGSVTNSVPTGSEMASARSTSIAAPKTTTKTRSTPGLTTETEDSVSQTVDGGISPAQHQAYVDSRVEELMDLAMTDDPNSLNTILSELTNRDPEIRKAALEASVQFGSRDAIPKLTDAASQTDDPKEKAAIVEAIEFLKLPSATEVAQAGGVKSVAQRMPPKSSSPARSNSPLVAPR